METVWLVRALHPERLPPVLKSLCAGPRAEEELLGDFGFVSQKAEVLYAIHRLAQEGVVDHLLQLDGRAAAAVSPKPGRDRPCLEPVSGTAMLSRYVYVRPSPEGLTLHAPLASASVTLLAPELYRVLTFFSTRRMIPDDAGVSGVPLPLVYLLNRAGYLAEDENEVSYWEFHDLLFHCESRAGLSSGRVGGTYRFSGRVTPPAAGEPQSKVISLPAPVAAVDDVLERRRSVRSSSGRALTLDELGAFLYRALASREGDRRVYPSGGGIHELEFYVAAGKCDRLERGLYWYNAQQHGLQRLPADLRDVELLLRGAAAATHGDEPQAVVTAAARLPLVAWKYEGMAYRTILLNAGAALQTMYLAATALGLGPCAVGNGDTRLFSKAAGINPLDQPVIIEFTLRT